MNDSLLNLALSLHANPGVYALLLGSGVSRSAGIPTGWEIVVSLVDKLRKLLGDDSEADAESWYQVKFGKEPEYSSILEQIAATAAERNRLLRSYFEPNEEEREQWLKLPTAAHKAIASLVKKGFVRMILTTNFDRLLESSLEEQGITPDVISTDDALSGALPYVHSKITIVKLHGDYRDTRIKNTAQELTQYSSEISGYLDRVLDDFGLIVCGWSGEWDIALRNAILRCPSRRFTTYWTSIGEPKEDAKRIIEHRHAQVIPIESADKFFSDLLDKVSSLQEVEPLHPISTAIAIATTKRFLSEHKYNVRLHDLISEELEKVYGEISSARFDTHGEKIGIREFQARMHGYETISDTLLGILTTISYFDSTGSNAYHLTRCIERLNELPQRDGLVALIDLQRYPALLIAYATGISSIAARHYAHLASILITPKARENNKTYPAISQLNVWDVFTHEIYKWVPRPNAEREYTPANEYIHDVLRDCLRPYLPSDDAYQSTFDIFEYILALTYVDLVDKNRGPIGCFLWRYRNYGADRRSTPIEEFFSEGIAQGKNWELLSAGFFSGSVERLESVRERFDGFLQEVRRKRMVV